MSTPAEHAHGSTSNRFYPVTKKEHDVMTTTVLTDVGEEMVHKVTYGKGSNNDGVDTHTTSSRYVPATSPNKKGPFAKLFGGKTTEEQQDDEE